MIYLLLGNSKIEFILPKLLLDLAHALAADNLAKAKSSKL